MSGYKASHGFSLMEVMIGVFLSTLLMSGVIQLLGSSTSTYRLQLNQGRLEESVRLFRESLRLNPRDADGHDGLGQVLQRLGRTAEARTAYEAALRIDPDHPARRRIP